MNRHCYSLIEIDKDELQSLINNKASKKDIALHFGVSPSTINRYLIKYNINYWVTPKLDFYTIEMFKKDIKEIGNLVQIGKKYGVSDNAIRKWCVRNGLPYHLNDIIKNINNGSV